MEKARNKGELWGLSPQDVSVICALCAINFARPWFVSWHLFTYNLNLQSVASFHFMVFVCECFMCLGLALICDIRHVKYNVYMYFLYLYGIFPVYGLVETLLPSFTLRFMMDWMHSTSGIIFPIRYGAVFLQKPNISRMDCYVWLTIFEIGGALNRFVVTWVIPYNCPLRHASILPIWVVLLLAYFQILFLVGYAYKYAKKETFRERHLKVAIQGIALDRKLGNDVVWCGLGRKTLKFAIFVLLLVPAIYSTLLADSLRLVEIRKDLNTQRLVTTTHMFPLGSLIGTAVIAAGLIFVRWRWPAIADVCTLGIPHLLNTLALIIILGRLSGGSTGKVLEGVIPDESSMVLLFINTDYNNRSSCVYSENFEPMRIRAMEHLYRVVRTDKAEISFDVVLDPTYDTFLPVRHDMKVRMNSFVIIMIQLGTIPLRRDFVVNAVQVVELKGEELENVRPIENSQYVWMTSISEFVNKTVLRVTRNGSTVEHDLPQIDRAIVEQVPSVLTKISVIHISPIQEGGEFELAGSQGIPKPYTVYGVVIHEHNRLAALAVKRQRVRPSSLHMWPSRTTVHVVTLMKIRRPFHQRLPSRKLLREDPVLAAAYFIHGAADSLVMIGYLHLFWLDAPLRLRTSLMAVSRIIVWSLALLPDLKNIDYYSGSGSVTFTWYAVLSLLIVQVAATLLHFLLAHVFYFVFPANNLAKAGSSQAYGTPPNEPEHKA